MSADLAVSGPGAPADAWVQAWGVALAELEVAVEEAAAMLHHLPLPADVNVTRWAPPSVPRRCMWCSSRPADHSTGCSGGGPRCDLASPTALCR